MSLFTFLCDISSMNIIDTINNKKSKTVCARNGKKTPRHQIPGFLRSHLANAWAEG